MHERRSARPGFLSPVVRRLLAEHSLDPADIHGTGADGRVTRNDVLAAVAARAGAASSTGAAPVSWSPMQTAAPPASAAAPEAAPAPAPAASSVPSQPTQALAPRDEIVPFSPMRKRIAEHMVRSHATSPHAFTSVLVDFEAVERVRREHGPRWRADEGFPLTYLPFVARAVVDAIREVPIMNASVGQNNVVLHQSVDLGVAVDIELEGLLVPVVRDADVKRLRGIAREVFDLATRARNRTLSPDELVGGTITITNPGPFGTLNSLPVINQPQVAIVATDLVRREPVVTRSADGTEGIGIHAVSTIGVSFDARVVGLDQAAKFLQLVRDAIENRDWSQEL